jgi:hypothetical protein
MNHLHRSPISAGLLVALVLTIAGCSDSGSDDSAADSSSGSSMTAADETTAAPPTNRGSASPDEDAAGVAGAWSGSWERTEPVPGNGELNLDLSQDGGAISGSLSVTGSACMTTHDVTGTLDGDHVDFEVSDGGLTAAYDGTLDGTEMTGTMTVTCPGVGTGTGTWTVSE